MKRLWLLLCLLGLAACGRAQPPLVIILLPGTSLEGWRAADAPHLHQLMATGALAVMNTRTARLPNDHARETPESAALTLGAGARAAGGSEATAFLPVSAVVPGLGVSAGELWARRTGRMPLPGQYVNVHWPATLRANGRLGYRLRLGALADVLASRNIQVLAGGGPYAAGVAADSGGALRRSPHLTAAQGQCVIWDAGSDVRAADESLQIAAVQVARLHGRLLILSPFAGNHDYAQGRRLTPLLEWGAGVPAGLLRSPSTRRAGLVTNTDFAPTVGSYYGIKREDFPVRPFGEAWTAFPAPHAEHRVRTQEEQAERQARSIKLLPYLAFAFAVWMLVGTRLAGLKRLPCFWPIVPLALLVALLFGTTILSVFVWFGLLLALGGVLAERFGAREVTLTLLTVLTASLLLDMLTGSRLMQRGLLGYSAIEGARYYGIGNEAMGALIGAVLVLVARLWQPFGHAREALLFLLGMVSLLLGSPTAGAKAGGLLVSLIAFGTLGFALLGGRWSARVALALTIFVVAAMTCTAAGEAFLSHGTHSHVGEAVRRIQTGGWSEAGDIAARKLAVDSRLAYHSAWACPLWGGLLCLALLWRGRGAATQEERALHVAGLVGLAACVALNDAGVVAGALCLIPLWCDSAVSVTKRKPPAQRLLYQGLWLRRRDY